MISCALISLNLQMMQMDVYGPEGIWSCSSCYLFAVIYFASITCCYHIFIIQSKFSLEGYKIRWIA